MRSLVSRAQHGGTHVNLLPMILRKKAQVSYRTLANGSAKVKNNKAMTDTTPLAPAMEQQQQPEADNVATLKALIAQLEREKEELALQRKAADLQRDIAEGRLALQSASSTPQQQQSLPSPPAAQPPPPPPANNSTRGHAGNLGELYELGALPPNSYQPNRLDLNPQCYLHIPATRKSRYRSIPDFIPNMARGRGEDEEEHEVAPGVKMVVGRPSRLETVTPAQWVAASSCILADIIANHDHKCDVKQLTLDYLSYQAKVGELACRYTWKSVIQFDDEYREKQHTWAFRWGSDSPHLYCHLQPRDDKKMKERPKYDKQRRDQTQTTGNGSARPCWSWNNGQPCRRNPCPFLHACEWCKSTTHKKTGHDQELKA